MFSQLSIRTKITALVAILLLALSALGALSLLTMRTLHASTADIATSWLPSVRVLGDLRYQVMSYRNDLREHLLGETLDEKKASESKLARTADDIAKTRQSYEKLITSPEESALYKDFSSAWTTYMEKAPKLLELSRQELGAGSHQAHQIMIQTLVPIGTKADKILTDDVNLNNNGADVATKDAESTFKATFVLVLAILSAAVAAGIAAGVLVIRDVSRGIASVIQPMQDFTKGDLSAEVPHRGEKTEIGQMADALQVFKDALIAKKAADEAAAKDAQDKIARGQRVDAATRQFESAIGEIVETVSSASTELEASAGTLTTTAERTQEVTTTVAAASEQASANVQSVASATEQMSSSITEISRQGLRATPSSRRVPPTTASASWRTRRRGSAPWSN
jgi:methyl-accepting chemotaxis protein